jgi:hypothetical protein
LFSRMPGCRWAPGVLVCGPGRSCATTNGLHEGINSRGVDFQQPGADAHGVEPAGGDPATDRAVADIAAVGSFLKSD